MPTKSINNNNNDNKISLFQEENYVSFNSENPFNFNKYVF